MRINVDVRLKKLVLRGIGVVFAILGIIVFIKYLLLPLLPFVLAYLISVGIRPISKLISAEKNLQQQQQNIYHCLHCAKIGEGEATSNFKDI